MKEFLPDPMTEEHPTYEALQWVGMEAIEALFCTHLETEFGDLQIPCLVNAMVSLDKKSSRGIHMSRIYLLVQKGLQKKISSLKELKDVLNQILKTHEELSSFAKLEIHFKLPILRKALKSSEKGLRNYKCKITLISSTLKEEIKTRAFLNVEVVYSSTCPASASLVRQLQKQHFENTFSEKLLERDQIIDWLDSTESVIATPHAQRSLAKVQVEVSSEEPLQVLSSLITDIENVLQTAVQGPVKREDEQEFARRNGNNLMFCEDAARKLKVYLQKQSFIFSYKAKVSHLESLHPHNAVAYVQGKNV